MLSPRTNELTGKIIGCAIEVHRALGPGLLESIYLACLIIELRRAGLKVDLQVSVPIVYRGVTLDCCYALDVVVEGTVVLELKCVAAILPVHEAQLVTYLKLANKPIGVLINFNVSVLKNGIVRKINSSARVVRPTAGRAS